MKSSERLNLSFVKVWSCGFCATPLVLIALLVGATPSITAHPQVDWLISQRESSGLYDSYQGDGSDVAYPYDQALIAIALAAAGEDVLAAEILSTLAALQDPDGSWPTSFSSRSGASTNNSRDSGAIAWIVLAINFYQCHTRDKSFAEVAETALDFLETRIDKNPQSESYGSILHSDELPDARSTEHAHDAFRAFLGRRRKETACLLREYVAREVWAPSPSSDCPYHDVSVFWRGFMDCNWVTDVQSWGVLAQGPIGPNGETYHQALEWLYDNPFGSTRNTISFGGEAVDGFRGNVAEASFIWVEGTEGVAAAFYSIGDNARGDFFHSQMESFIQPNGSLLFSASGDGGAEDFPENFQHGAINATAWHYFNEARINPFQPCQGRGRRLFGSSRDWQESFKPDHLLRMLNCR